MSIERSQLVAMAVAAVAEEEKIDISRIRVVYFKELKKSGLARYIEENNISYKKYQLGDRS